MATLWEMREIHCPADDDGFYWSNRNFQIALVGGGKSILPEPVWTLNEQDYQFFRDFLQIQLTQTRSKVSKQFRRGKKKKLYSQLEKDDRLSERKAAEARSNSSPTLDLLQDKFEASVLSSVDQLGKWSPKVQRSEPASPQKVERTESVYPSSPGRFSCALCGKTFKLAYNLKVHERVHTDFRPYRCLVCEKRCKQMGHIQKHMQQQHPGQEDNYGYQREDCDDNEPIVKSSHIKRKYVRRSSKSVSSSSCEGIPLAISTIEEPSPEKSDPMMTTQDLMSIMKPCRIVLARCDNHPLLLRKSLSNSSQVELISRSPPSSTAGTKVTSQPRKRFRKYSPCTNILNTVKRLRLKYQRLMRLAKAEKKSSHPNPHTPSSSSSDNHVTLTLFKCTVCLNILRTKEELAQHMQCHETDKNGKSVDNQNVKQEGKAKKPNLMKVYHLARQIRNVTKECPKCFKIISHANNMLRHLLTHTGAKPYKCPICPKSFARKDGLKHHKFHAHPNSASHDKPLIILS